MCNKPGIVFWGQFLGPTKVTPTVAARMDGGGGIYTVTDHGRYLICVDMVCGYVPFQCTVQKDVDAHDQTPFFLGSNLTLYVTGKYRATRMHSGRANILNGKGMSSIHMSFASANGGVLSRVRTLTHESHVCAKRQNIEPAHRWTSIPSVNWCTGWTELVAQFPIVFQIWHFYRANVFVEESTNAHCTNLNLHIDQAFGLYRSFGPFRICTFDSIPSGLAPLTWCDTWTLGSQAHLMSPICIECTWKPHLSPSIPWR